MVGSSMLARSNVLNVKSNRGSYALRKEAVFTAVVGARPNEFADQLIHHECPFGPLEDSRKDRARVCKTVRILNSEINSWYSARSSAVNVPLLHFSASSSILCWVTASACNPRSSAAASCVKTRPIGSTICWINVDDGMVSLYVVAAIAAKSSNR
jgi:hypothetical protein